MMQLQQMALTHALWYPAEKAERERNARRSALAATARAPKQTAAPAPAPRRSWVPRIAGALGLF